jgi:hypothetical protein
VHDQPTEHTNVGGAIEREADLVQLKERLAFYESFDQLIQENITRAGDLLREAAAKRSETELALRSSTAEIERRQLEGRVQYRKVFSGLLDQIQTVQQNVERLAREVSDALDDLEAVIPARGELGAGDDDDLPPLPTFQGPSGGSLASGIGQADEPAEGEIATLEPVDEIFPGGTEGSGALFSGVGTSQTMSEEMRASVERLSASSAGEAEIDDGLDEEPIAALENDGVEVDDFDVSPEEPYVSTDESGADREEATASTYESWATSEPVTEPEDTDAPGVYPLADRGESDSTTEESAEINDVTTTILVHGVPRATTALSLKRYLEALEQVHAVEPREYAEGVLRLHVLSNGPIGMAELQGWSEAVGMEPVSIEESFVEVKLP